ncbi:MAG: M3 family oligoendopeptidase [Verrucomicrobium sp.]|nr:M3 family oligoendopeptidase [Verrucomicrobium sp.]
MKKLHPYRPRTFLPADIDLGDLDALKSVFQRLDQGLDGAKTVEDLQKWIEDSDEVSAALGEEGAKRYIAHVCHTDDVEAEAAYEHFTQKVGPALSPLGNALDKKLFAHPAYAQLPAYYDEYRRGVQLDLDLYREKNIERRKQLSKLDQAYDKLISQQEIEFEGEKMTLVQAANILDEPDRARRQAVFEAMSARRLADRQAIDDIYDQQLALRQAVAEEAGFDNYRDYSFKAKDRAYTPDDCLAFHKAIEEHVVPLARLIQEDRLNALRATGQLGADEPLRPWDLAVDAQGREPLHPFHGGQELFDKVEEVFKAIDPRFLQSFDLMREYEAYDLDNHKGKGPGGFQYFLSESAVPFIFMNAADASDDMETLKHENGHATHSIQARDQKLAAYRHAPMEMCELASMSAELICASQLEKTYSKEDAGRVRREQLEKIVSFLPWMATVDAFQHWVYTNPGHTKEQRTEAFQDLQKRFGGTADWSGYEESRGSAWQRQSHIVTNPFYYVDYGVAQLGALQVERNFKQDPRKGLDAYFHGLSQGGSKPLAELYKDAGVKLDLTANMVAPLIAGIRQELGYPPAKEVPVPRTDLGKAPFRRPGAEPDLAGPDQSRQK